MSRKKRVAEALDQCVARLARGESVSQCLYGYSRYSAELRPLLEIAIALRRLPQPKQRPEAVKTGYDRMMMALRAKSRSGALSRRGRSARSPAPPRWPVASWWLGAVGALALLLLLIAGGVLLSVDPLSAEVVITKAEGLVLRLPAGTRSWVPAQVGDRLAVGDRLQTAADGRVALSLAGSYLANLLSSAEIAVVALPSPRQASEPLVIYQEEGSVIYDVVLAGDGESPSQVTPQVAVPFEVRTPVAATRVSRARFVTAVGVDGATAVSVDDGEVTVTAGKWVQVTHADEVTVVGVARDAEPVTYTKGELPPGWGWGLGLEENTQPPPGPPGDGVGPPGIEGKERDHQPPGLEEKGSLPPGQVDKWTGG